MQDEPLLRDAERAKASEAGQVLREVGRDFVRYVVQLSPAFIRFAVVAASAVGVVYGTYDAWLVFGGDLPAAIPAFALGLIPLLFAFVNGVKWGGMLGAAALTYGVAQGLSALPFPLNQISIVVALAALTFSDMSRRSVEREPDEHTK